MSLGGCDLMLVVTIHISEDEGTLLVMEHLCIETLKIISKSCCQLKLKSI